jgi:chemotaxis protein CheC
MNDLPAPQYDALLELLSAGCRDAKTALSRMRREPIELSLADVRLQARSEAVNRLVRRDAGLIYGVAQELDGALSGTALFVLPQEQGLELVQLLLGRRLQPNALSTLEQEALLEIGNIVLCALLAALSDKLDLPAPSALPTLYRGNAANLLESSAPQDEALSLRLSCHLKFHRVESDVLLLLDAPSCQRLRLQLERFVPPGATS